VSKIEGRSIFALLAAGLVAGSGVPIATPSIGDAVATASANIADNLSDGPHLGFDTFSSRIGGSVTTSRLRVTTTTRGKESVKPFPTWAGGWR